MIATASLSRMAGPPSERVTGIGGVFFRARDPEALVAWYEEHLGVPVVAGYTIFPESRDTHWIPFAADTDYWPAEKQSMVNFTVRDLDGMLAQLRASGVAVDDKVEDGEYGRFGWATDPEGNRFELWQPRERRLG
jgi:predicted enzyme related to lactoylglutathione lyase